MVTDYQALQALCRENLGAFTYKAFGVVESADNYQHNWHIDCIAEHLMAVWRHEIRRLVINMPPRTLKTHSTSVSFPAWGMGKDPTIKFMLTSFKGSLAEKMTRKTRMVMKSEWYRSLYPGTVISNDLDRQYYFETTRNGQYFSSSMSSVLGEGADIQICDDPVAPDEALSDKIRESTNETIRGTLFSRFNDPRTGRFILNMQRLHEDDPTGNLLKDGGWHHLKLPAEVVKPIFIVLGSKEWKLDKGDLLFPARFTREVLDEYRQRLGDYNYSGQYLQEPTPLSGGMLKPAWVQFYAPGGAKPKEMNVVILVDPAGADDDEKKRKDKNTDWTAMMVVGLAPDNNYYLLDIIRDKLNATERIDTLFMLHRKWSALTGKSPKVGYERYSMQSDIHYVKKKMQEDGWNFALTELAGPKSKTSRMARLVPDMQNGRWFFPQSLIYVDIDGRRWDLVQEILTTEMPHIPYAKHDDMTDALARVYEPELFMAFPKPRATMAQKAVTSAARGSSGDDWTSW